VGDAVAFSSGEMRVVETAEFSEENETMISLCRSDRMKQQQMKVEQIGRT